MPPTTSQRRATSRRATAHRNPARATAPRRPLRRKQPDPSKAQQFLGMIGRAAPAKAVAGSGKKKPMGLAMLGAGAAAAFSQREKLVGLFGKRKDEMPQSAPPQRPVAATEPPVAPTATHDVAPERPDGSAA